MEKENNTQGQVNARLKARKNFLIYETEDWQMHEVIERCLNEYAGEQLNLASGSTRQQLTQDIVAAIKGKFYTVAYANNQGSDHV